ncbi:MAG: hypothetical protein V1918_07520 [Planctomycetota bacterium]
MDRERISTSRIEEGMILADDVTLPGGRVLLAAETKLTKNHAAQLKKHGVVHVFIQAGTGPSAPPAAPGEGNETLPTAAEYRLTQRLAEVRERIDRLFSRAGEDERMALIHALAVERVKRIALHLPEAGEKAP